MPNISELTRSYYLSLADFDFVMFYGYFVDCCAIQNLRLEYNARIWFVYAAQQQTFRLRCSARHNDLKKEKKRRKIRILFKRNTRLFLPQFSRSRSLCQ